MSESWEDEYDQQAGPAPRGQGSTGALNPSAPSFRLSASAVEFVPSFAATEQARVVGSSGSPQTAAAPGGEAGPGEPVAVPSMAPPEGQERDEATSGGVSSSQPAAEPEESLGNDSNSHFPAFQSSGNGARESYCRQLLRLEPNRNLSGALAA